MPSPLPSTFASAAAAAANNTQETPRRDTEWPRRMNAPQTFRRPSLATSTSHSRDLPAGNTSGGPGTGAASGGAGAGAGAGAGGATAGSAAAPLPPTGGPAAAAGGANADPTSTTTTNTTSASPITTSYTKDHLLAIYKSASTSTGWPAAAVADFFLADWNPRVPSVAAAAVAAAGGALGDAGAAASGAIDDLGPWGKEKDELGLGVGKSVKTAAQKVGPEICWDHTGGMEPLSLIEMGDAERELFSTTINSPLKPPPAKSSTTGTPTTNATIDLFSSSNANTPLSLATPSRKSSLAPFSSSGQDTGLTPSSALSNRPGARRRDTSDTGPLGAASPTTLAPGSGSASRFFRGVRDRDSFANAGDDEQGAAGAGSRKESLDAAFSGLKRGSNASAAGAGPWSSPGGGFSAFGNFPLSKTGKDGDKRPSLTSSGRVESRFKDVINLDKDGKGRKEGEKRDGALGVNAGNVANAGTASGDDGWTSVGKTRKMRSETNPFADDEVPQLPQTSAPGNATAGGGHGLHNVRFGEISSDINSGMRSMDMDMDMPAVQLPSDIQAELSGDNFDMSFGLPANLRELVSDTPGSGAVTPPGRNKQSDGRGGDNDLNSPTNTNPYKEGELDNDVGPDGQGQQASTDDNNTRGAAAGGAAPGLANLAQLRDEAMGSHPGSPFTGFRRPDVANVAGADRSQTSSTAPGAASRPFSGLAGFAAGFPGLAGLGTGPAGSMVSSPVTGHAGPVGVGVPGSGTATPTRGAGGLGAFGDPIFGNMGGMKGFSGGPMGLGGGMMGMDMGMNMMGGMSGIGGLPGMPGAGGIGGMGGIGMGMSPGLSMSSPAAQSATGPVTSSGRQSKMGALFGAAGGGSNAGDGDKGADGQTQSRASPFEGATPGQTRTPGGLLNPLGGLDIGGFGPFGGPAQIAPPPLPQQIIPNAGADGELPHQATAAQEKMNLPASQQRQMVMPDRMRWIYRDPQGNTQGPWSGLEMHDWFKAGFFTAELQVKKLEDEEYEPLAQLVRRIGNSREPFLVPQIGVPHGPEPSQPSSWGSSGVVGTAGTSAPGGGPTNGPSGAGNASGIAQPPFAGSFPSFGTTLTADQQNALERRKQEEQYLMARQKEHLAQQQAIMRLQAQAQAQAQQAQAAHQAQQQAQVMGVSPTNANAGVAGLPAQPGVSGPGGVSAPGHPLLGMLGPEVLGAMNLGAFGGTSGAPDELPGLFDRLNVGGGRGQFPFGGAVGVGAPRPQQPQQQQQTAPAQAQQGQAQPQQGQQPQPQPDAHAQNVQNILQDRASLAAEQEQFDRANEDGGLDPQAREERLRQFQGLRDEQKQTTSAAETKEEETPKAATKQQKAKNEVPTLTEQVQKAAAAQHKQQQAEAQTQSQSVWGKVDSNVASPFPPPHSQSPLPAPSAQRSRSNVADNLTATSNEQMPTALETAPPVSAPAPTAAAPASIAPWAKDVAEAPKVKGPSLKEIQEAEARKAAEAEKLAAAARALAAEQERLSQPPPPAPGLPSTANWASSAASAANNKDDHAPGVPATSVWGKQGGNKVTGAAPAKKTLAQIQKEEEARKQKFAAQQAAAANAAAAAAAQSPSGNAGSAFAVNAATPAGKRYADLAGKMAQSTQSTPGAAGVSNTAAAGGGAWTTVGAGGKVKTPAPAPAATTGARVTPVATVIKPRSVPVAPVRAAAPAPSANNTTRALEELSKWAKNALRNGMNSSINIEDFVQQLAILPAESEIISDCIYAHSTTLDGRRFGEEYVRRRKLADKGVVESGGTVADHSEGWNEVAKKGPVHARQHDDHPAEFKVVTKKKGKR